jgi:hypothetical protein
MNLQSAISWSLSDSISVTSRSVPAKHRAYLHDLPCISPSLGP